MHFMRNGRSTSAIFMIEYGRHSYQQAGGVSEVCAQDTL